MCRYDEIAGGRKWGSCYICHYDGMRMKIDMGFMEIDCPLIFSFYSLHVGVGPGQLRSCIFILIHSF